MNILEYLKSENPKANPLYVQLVADALETYIEAQKNIVANGAVCAHPRTGAPIENPYIKIRVSQIAVLAKFKMVQTSKTLKALEK
jgi:hypothetical protein